jgi:hypothetical protein
MYGNMKRHMSMYKFKYIFIPRLDINMRSCSSMNFPTYTSCFILWSKDSTILSYHLHVLEGLFSSRRQRKQVIFLRLFCTCKDFLTYASHPREVGLYFSRYIRICFFLTLQAHSSYVLLSRILLQNKGRRGARPYLLGNPLHGPDHLIRQPICIFCLIYQK